MTMHGTQENKTVLHDTTFPMQHGSFTALSLYFAYLSLAHQDSLAYSEQQVLVLLLHWKLLFLVAQLYELSQAPCQQHSGLDVS